MVAAWFSQNVCSVPDGGFRAQNPRGFDNACDIETVEVTPGERGIRVAEYVAEETEHSHVHLAHL
jgi:hypothetical protein